MPAKSRQQIASEYGVCTKTLNKWLKTACLTIPAGLIIPCHQKMIYNKLGAPNYAAEPE
jgi:abortive infection bacteriophage resistance protein